MHAPPRLPNLHDPPNRFAMALPRSLPMLLALLACLVAAAARQPRLLVEEAPAPEPAPEDAEVTPTVQRFSREERSTAAAALPWLQSSNSFGGDGTAYSDAVNNTGTAFACSFRYMNDKFSRHFAAINQGQWDSGAACGRCIKARCVDPRCKVQNEPLLVQVVDLCPECKPGDVDFSFPAYRAITGMWPHRLRIDWEWASCAPEISGTISYTPKDGITPFWQAFYLANFRYPIKSASLNGAELLRSPYQFFIHPAAAPAGGAVLELTADNGMKLSATIADMTKAQDLAVQFPLGP